MRPIEKRLDKLASELCGLLHHGTCYLCDKEGHDAHHIVGRSYSRHRWSQENLVFLCRMHHRRITDGEIELDSELGEGLSLKFKIWSLGELEDIEAELKKKIKELI